jgi:hypothetical protein
MSATLIYVSSTRNPAVQVWALDRGGYVVVERDRRHEFDYLPEARAYAFAKTRTIKAERSVKA